MEETLTPPVPEPLPEPEETLEYWRDRANQLEQANSYYQQQLERLDDLQLSLEIANERWVAQVNENTAIAVELRKLKRGK